MPTDSNAKNTQTRDVTNTPERNVSIARDIILGRTYKAAGARHGLSGERARQIFVFKIRQLRGLTERDGPYKGSILEEVISFQGGGLERVRSNSGALIPMLNHLLKSGIVK